MLKRSKECSCFLCLWKKGRDDVKKPTSGKERENGMQNDDGDEKECLNEWEGE
jgi:hypothetical protein